MRSVGDPFGENFRIVEFHGGEGESGEADIYVIEHKSDKRRFVAKTIQERYNPLFGLLRLQVEAVVMEIVACHSNFVKCHGLLVENDAPYLILEYVDGVTLESKIKGGGFSFHETIDWCVQMANALCFIRKQGIIHADLTERNILVTSDNKVKLIDIGGSLPEAILKILPDQSKQLTADADRFGKIIQRLYNTVVVEEMTKALPQDVNSDVRKEWEGGWKHMAETSENLFKLTGGIALFILDAPKSSKEMMKAELPITSIVKQLRWLKGHNKLDFEWIWKELIRIHDQLDSYENCALRE